MASLSTSPTQQLSRSLHPNTYAPLVPSPLNPNPTQSPPPRPQRRVIRRHTKVASVSVSSGTSGTTSSTSSARRTPRPVTTTQRLLRRKAEEAIRVHNLYRHIQETAQKQFQDAHDASRRRQKFGASGTDSGDLGVVHISIDEKERNLHEVDDWSLGLDRKRDEMEDLDLGQFEHKLGMGWHNSDVTQQTVVDARKRPQRLGIAGVLRRPSRGFLLAVALVCLFGLPALRGQAFFRRAGTFAGSV